MLSRFSVALLGMAFCLSGQSLKKVAAIDLNGPKGQRFDYLTMQVRQARSRPLLEALHASLKTTMSKLSRKSELAKAIHYALERWAALTVFVDDGRVEMDNNAAERALRTVAIGRNNYLFAGSDAGGERAAPRR